MKNMKVLVALVLVAMMSLALVSSAFADGAVVNNTTHTYNVYQIFSGTQTATAGDTKLGDIDWGIGINSSDFLTALQGDSRFNAGDPAANVFASATTAKQVAEILAANSSMATAFANVAAENLGTSIASVTGNAVSPELPAGYYLFVDTSTVTTDDALNSALLQITNTTLTIAKKYNVPSLDKDIVENGSNVEAADKAIGDTVTYELKGTLPSNYADYETYKYVFHDTISAGQAIDFDSFTIKLDNPTTGTDISTLFTNSLTADTTGSAETTFTLTASNLKTNTSINADSVIYVRYNVTITADAVIGETGNENESWIEYSNNPNQTGSGEPTTSTTPHDHTLVFTYELQPTKVDGTDHDTKLTGAQFVLKATNGEHSGSYVLIDASTHKLTGWTTTKPTAVDTAPTSGNTGVLVSAAGGLFEVYGLDSGNYELEEIKAPIGYNLLTDPIEIVIAADIDDDETTGPSLTELTITVDGTPDTTNYANTGILPMTVENNGGTTLPSTGGIGTTIFYAAGLVLVLGAAVVLISRRKAEAED